MPTQSKNNPDDTLVPDPVVCREFGITSMSLHRWTRDPELDFPPAVKIRERNFRSRKALEEFKQKMIRRATGTRRTATA